MSKPGECITTRHFARHWQPLVSRKRPRRRPSGGWANSNRMTPYNSSHSTKQNYFSFFFLYEMSGHLRMYRIHFLFSVKKKKQNKHHIYIPVIFCLCVPYTNTAFSPPQQFCVFQTTTTSIFSFYFILYFIFVVAAGACAADKERKCTFIL